MTEPDFSKKFSFSQNLGKWAQIGPKSDFFGLFSKSAPTFFLIFWILLEGNSALILPKTACLGNSGSGITAPKVVKSTYFQRRISRERVEQIQICFHFQKVRSLVFRKCGGQIFAISTPSPRKLRSKFGSQKGPKMVFLFSQVWVVRFCSNYTNR